jgi:protein-tyrosine-phosphatase/DNA-binding transcriptional ArsR family regulator
LRRSIRSLSRWLTLHQFPLIHHYILMYSLVMAADSTPSRFVQLLADEQRWRLLQELAQSDRKVSELTQILGRPQNLLSYHLAALRDEGIVLSRRSSADRRDSYYRIDLRRCVNLLSGVGNALQPGLRLHIDEPRLSGTRTARRRPNVLFLCTGNSARSQMAEALLDHHSRGAVRVRSAGSHPKPLHQNAVRVMAERGIDISKHRTKHLDRFRKMRFDRVITLCDKLREICPEFPGASVTAHWSMADPAIEGTTDEATYAAFKRTAEELEARIPFLIGGLVPHKGEEHTNE